MLTLFDNVKLSMHTMSMTRGEWSVTIAEASVDPTHTDGLEWHRSSWCNGGDCVEVASSGDSIMIRDSAYPDRGMLAITRDEWRDWTSRAKEGSFGEI
jgi:hypothetical protein